MKALVLAAGYATRLYPLTKDYPKPLLQVRNKPIINYIIEKLDNIDEIDEVIVVTNSRFISHFRKWARGLRTKKRLSLIDDLTKALDKRRGAIGDMSFVINKKRIKNDLLVIGGDNLFDSDLKEFFLFIRAHKKNPVIGAYDLKDRVNVKKYGVIRLNTKNRVVDFQEKPEKPKSTLVAMCLYYFPKEKLSLIGEYLTHKRQKYDATGSYIDWLKKNEPVYAFIFGGRWYDIGDHKYFKKAKETFLT